MRKDGVAIFWYNIHMRNSRDVRQTTILVDMSLRRASDRDVLSGVFQYMDSIGRWTVKLRLHDENPLTADVVRSAMENGISGFIICEQESADTLDALSISPLPTVAVGFGVDQFKKPPTRMAVIRGDTEAMGAMGAQYLMSLGRFASFAFVGEEWSDSRCSGFGGQIKAKGLRFDSFKQMEIAEDTIPKLSEWLSGLQKPVAIMAACDRVAVRVLDACDMAHMRVPDQIAVLGADNDEFLCSHSSPPLSSILPWHSDMGFRAAKELDRLISAKKPAPAKVVVLRPVKVVERDSTAAIAPASRLVERAMAFIRQNACSGITVKDVVAHLHVSRRLAELRYRSISGESMGEAILKTRLARVKRLLASSHRPISGIAADCGFRRPNNLAHLFKKRFSTTMRDYRAQHQTK